MRGRFVTILAWLVIVACVVIVFIRIKSAYSPPDGGTMIPSPAPLVPTTTTTSAAAVASRVPTRPRRTVTTWVTVTPASTAGEDGQ
jgi:hypothetical protein